MQPLLSALAVDDNPAALSTIERYAEKIPWLQLVQCFTEALPAVAYLKAERVEVGLLDVEMDDFSGLDFIQLIKDQNIASPQFVIISAHEQYALKGFELNVVDYLHKPFSYHRFVQDLERVKDRLAQQKSNRDEKDVSSRKDPHLSDYLFVHHQKKLIKLFKQDITLVKSDGHFCYLYLKGQTRQHLSYSLSEMEQMLAGNSFLRVHKSYLVNIRHIQQIGTHIFLEDGEEVPIGSTYRSVVQQLCQRLSGR